MSAISIIHAPGDARFGEQIADALSRDGHKVKRHSGDPLSGDLGLDDNLAIVVWSGAAAKLARIHEQAREALARGALIPVALGDALPPRGFENLPPVDLSGWTGAVDDPRWRFVLGEIDVAAHRDILEDGAVWADAIAEEQQNETGVPASAIILDAEWPPENDDQVFDAEFDDDFAREEISSESPDYVLQRHPAGFQPIHVAIGASLGLAVLTAAAAILAPIFLSSPAQIASTTPPPETATPATLAFVKPVAVDEEENAAAISDADDGVENATPTATLALMAPVDGAGNSVDAPDTEKSVKKAAPETEAPAETEIDLTSVMPDDAALEDLVAATTSKAAPEDTDPSTDESIDRIAAGDYFKDCETCPDMAALAAGGFSMGSPTDEPARHVAEGPLIGIVLSKGFALGATEVTFAQWLACVDDGGCKGHAPYDHGWGRGDRPVVDVSFEDAQAYADWLSAKTGHRYRLPSEAEWEYAARAGAAAAFSFGGTISTAQANFNGDHAYGVSGGINRVRTTPVASFAPNAFGIFDMHGNLWEWTADCWSDSHGGLPSDGTARGGNCGMRVLKGGAWNTGGWRLRSAHRIAKDQTAREYDNGFRVARDMD